MGYMGFGMQKWIYSRNPKKKLYQKKKLQSFTALSKYSRNFKLSYRARENKTLLGLTSLFFVVGLILLVKLSNVKFTEYSNKHTELTMVLHENKNQVAYRFLIRSGKNRLLDNRALDAYKEFKLAYAIFPQNEELNQLLIETLSTLCKKNSIYCKELDMLLLKY